MRIGLFPIALFLAIGIVVLAIWALSRAINKDRGKGRVVGSYAIILIVCCTTLWLGLCFFFMIFSSLGHSPHPLRDSWPQCLVSFLVLIVLPLILLAFLAKRRSG